MCEFLIELQEEYERIAKTQIGRLDPGLSADEVIEKCKEIADDMREFRSNTDRLLNDYLYPILDDPENITYEMEADLYEAAQNLSSYEYRTDPGLALRVYRGLLEWARSMKDEDKIIRYLYWCGITLYFFSTGVSGDAEQREKTFAYFEEGATYADRYFSFEDPDTRKYIHRCLGNKCMMYYTIGQPQKAMEFEEECYDFWNRIMFSGKDPDFPWLSYFLTCMNHRHSFLVKTAHTDPDSVTRDELRAILDNAITINKMYSTNRELFNVFGGTRYDFMLWEAQFLSGLTSFDHLYEHVFNKKKEFDFEDFSPDAMYVKINLNSYLMFYAAKMQKLKDRKDEIIARVMRNSIEYFSSIPMSVSPQSVCEQLMMFASNLSDIFEPTEHMDFVLKMTTFRHIPTYAHSIVVAKIASLLTKRLIWKNPECFVGFMGLANVDDVKRKAITIYRFAENCGLCHDIGKLTYVSNPFMHIRPLTEDELLIVQQHTDIGAKMLAREYTTDIHKGYIEVIRGHHRYYDNSSGYPEDFNTEESEFKIMIDIMSVSNAIEAATEDISRAHTASKSLDEICEEIKGLAGSRYSPVVVEMLEDDVVIDALRRILNEDRKNAFYMAYLHAWKVEGI